MKQIFDGRTKSWKSLDYVAGWFMKSAEYGTRTESAAVFASTNSICQGQQVPILWPLVFATDHEIAFAHTSFKWSNLASHKAGVTVAIVSISNHAGKMRRLYSIADDGKVMVEKSENINAYLVSAKNVIISPKSKSEDDRGLMVWGNKPTDGGHLFLTATDRSSLIIQHPEADRFIKKFIGAKEFIQGQQRYCLWIEDDDRIKAEAIPEIAKRLEGVAKMRSESKAAETRPAAAYPHRFRQIQSIAKAHSLVVAGVSSERSDFLPVGLSGKNTIIGQKNFALYDAPAWNMGLLASRLHRVWIWTVCVRLRTAPSYSNTLGWNTFPVPTLTDQNKADLTRCAEDILLARESHWPATIAELYDPEKMPDNLREAHDRNDETLERIYIGRRFKNDTERLEKLFEMYTAMTDRQEKAAKPVKKKPVKRKPEKEADA